MAARPACPCCVSGKLWKRVGGYAPPLSMRGELCLPVQCRPECWADVLGLLERYQPLRPPSGARLLCGACGHYPPSECTPPAAFLTRLRASLWLAEVEPESWSACCASAGALPALPPCADHGPPAVREQKNKRTTALGAHSLPKGSLQRRARSKELWRELILPAPSFGQAEGLWEDLLDLGFQLQSCDSSVLWEEHDPDNPRLQAHTTFQELLQAFPDQRLPAGHAQKLIGLAAKKELWLPDILDLCVEQARSLSGREWSKQDLVLLQAALAYSERVARPVSPLENPEHVVIPVSALRFLRLLSVRPWQPGNADHGLLKRVRELLKGLPFFSVGLQARSRLLLQDLETRQEATRLWRDPVCALFPPVIYRQRIIDICGQIQAPQALYLHARLGGGTVIPPTTRRPQVHLYDLLDYFRCRFEEALADEGEALPGDDEAPGLVGWVRPLPVALDTFIDSGVGGRWAVGGQAIQAPGYCADYLRLLLDQAQAGQTSASDAPGQQAPLLELRQARAWAYASARTNLEHFGRTVVHDLGTPCPHALGNELRRYVETGRRLKAAGGSSVSLEDVVACVTFATKEVKQWQHPHCLRYILTLAERGEIWTPQLLQFCREYSQSPSNRRVDTALLVGASLASTADRKLDPGPVLSFLGGLDLSPLLVKQVVGAFAPRPLFDLELKVRREQCVSRALQAQDVTGLLRDLAIDPVALLLLNKDDENKVRDKLANLPPRQDRPPGEKQDGLWCLLSRESNDLQAKSDILKQDIVDRFVEEYKAALATLQLADGLHQHFNIILRTLLDRASASSFIEYHRQRPLQVFLLDGVDGAYVGGPDVEEQYQLRALALQDYVEYEGKGQGGKPWHQKGGLFWVGPIKARRQCCWAYALLRVTLLYGEQSVDEKAPLLAKTLRDRPSGPRYRHILAWNMPIEYKNEDGWVLHWWVQLRTLYGQPLASSLNPGVLGGYVHFGMSLADGVKDVSGVTTEALSRLLSCLNSLQFKGGSRPFAALSPRCATESVPPTAGELRKYTVFLLGFREHANVLFIPPNPAESLVLYDPWLSRTDAEVRQIQATFAPSTSGRDLIYVPNQGSYGRPYRDVDADQADEGCCALLCLARALWFISSEKNRDNLSYTTSVPSAWILLVGEMWQSSLVLDGRNSAAAVSSLKRRSPRLSLDKIREAAQSVTPGAPLPPAALSRLGTLARYCES